MPLYRCTECGCVENTGTSNYWTRKMDNQPLLCSACDPEIGQWHGKFPQESAVCWHIDQGGHLWREHELKRLPKGYTIVGQVQAEEPTL